MVFNLSAFVDFDLRRRFDLLLRARNLGRRGKHVKRTRIALIVILAIFLPLLIIVNVLESLQISKGLFNLANTGVSITLATVSIVIVFALLIVITLWIKNMDKGQRESKRVRQIVRKNWFLFAHNMGTIFVVLPLQVIPNISASDLPLNAPGKICYFCI